VKVSITISLPPKGCSPNTHRHWRKKGDAIRQYRQEAFACAAQQAGGIRFQRPVRVDHAWYMGKSQKESLKVIPPRYRPLDEGNAIAALKAAIDGVVDAGVLVSDSHDRVKWGECSLFRNKKEHQGRSCVVLTFTEVD